LCAADAATGRAPAFGAPDGSVAIPAYRVFQQGPPDWRARRFGHQLDTYGYVLGKPGARVYVSNASEARTYDALVGPAGQLTDLRIFAPRGGESVAVDARGRVFVANGQVYVYDKAGRALGRIDVPERPIQIVFGGADGRTLFMLAHGGLYRVRP
jgi:hypothetical protein